MFCFPVISIFFFKSALCERVSVCSCQIASFGYGCMVSAGAVQSKIRTLILRMYDVVVVFCFGFFTAVYQYFR